MAGGGVSGRGGGGLGVERPWGGRGGGGVSQKVSPADFLALKVSLPTFWLTFKLLAVLTHFQTLGHSHAAIREQCWAR